MASMCRIMPCPTEHNVSMVALEEILCEMLTIHRLWPSSSSDSNLHNFHLWEQWKMEFMWIIHWKTIFKEKLPVF